MSDNDGGGTAETRHSSSSPSTTYSSPDASPAANFSDDAVEGELHIIIEKVLNKHKTLRKVPTAMAKKMRPELERFYKEQTDKSLPDERGHKLISDITDVMKRPLDVPNQIVDISTAVALIFQLGRFPARNQLRTSETRDSACDTLSHSNNLTPQAREGAKDAHRHDKRSADFTNTSKPSPKRRKKQAGESTAPGVSKTERFAGKYRCYEGKKCRGKPFGDKNQWKKHWAEVHCPTLAYLCHICSHPTTRKDHLTNHLERHHPDRQGDYVDDPWELELADTYHSTCPYCHIPLCDYYACRDHILDHMEKDPPENLRWECRCGPHDWKKSKKLTAPQKMKRGSSSIPRHSPRDNGEDDQGNDGSWHSRETSGGSSGDPGSGSRGNQGSGQRGGNGGGYMNPAPGQPQDAGETLGEEGHEAHTGKWK